MENEEFKTLSQLSMSEFHQSLKIECKDILHKTELAPNKDVN